MCSKDFASRAMVLLHITEPNRPTDRNAPIQHEARPILVCVFMCFTIVIVFQQFKTHFACHFLTLKSNKTIGAVNIFNIDDMIHINASFELRRATSHCAIFLLYLSLCFVCVCVMRSCRATAFLFHFSFALFQSLHTEIKQRHCLAVKRWSQWTLIACNNQTVLNIHGIKWE